MALDWARAAQGCQLLDRPGVRQVPEGSGEQGKMEKTGCKIICGAPTTLAVKGLMMMMMTPTPSPKLQSIGLQRERGREVDRRQPGEELWNQK